jgi:hypothetical protein
MRFSAMRFSAMRSNMTSGAIRSGFIRSFSLSLLASILLASAALAQSPYSQGTSTYEAAVGFDYLHTTRVDTCCFGMKGFNGTFAYNATSNLSAVADLRSFSASNIASTGQNLRLTTFLAGPRVALRGGRFSPFAQALVGLGHGTSNFPLSNGSAWAASFGGGVDVPIKSIISWRVIEVGDLLTHIKNGGNNQQSSIQLSTGIVFGFGAAR